MFVFACFSVIWVDRKLDHVQMVISAFPFSCCLLSCPLDSRVVCFVRL